MGPGRGQHSEADVSGPLEEGAEIVAVVVERATAVAGKEGGRSQLRFIEGTVLFEPPKRCRCRVDRAHGGPSCSREVQPSPHQQPAFCAAGRRGAGGAGYGTRVRYATLWPTAEQIAESGAQLTSVLSQEAPVPPSVTSVTYKATALRLGWVRLSGRKPEVAIGGVDR